MSHIIYNSAACSLNLKVSSKYNSIMIYHYILDSTINVGFCRCRFLFVLKENIITLMSFLTTARYILTRAVNAVIYIYKKYESVSFTVVQCLLMTLIRIIRFNKKEKNKIRDSFFLINYFISNLYDICKI